MIRRVLIVLVGIALAAGLGALAYWGWLASQEERQREAARELSIKPPSRKIIDPKTQQVTIRVDAAGQERLGLIVEPIERRPWRKTVRLLGYSIPVPHRAVEMRSPWTGTLQASAKGVMPTVGQRVRKNQVLAVLSVPWSPTDRIQLENQLREVQGTIGETQASIDVTRSGAERLRSLTGGAVAAKQLLEAEGEMAKLAARLSAASAREKALQEALAKKESDIRFSFTVPDDGELTKVHRRPGEVVSAGDLVAAVYDPRELWVSLLVLPGQLTAGDAPQDAEIRFPGYLSDPLTGQLVQARPQVDRQQQALELVYTTANPQSRIPVGLQAEAQVKIGPPTEAAVVARSAVLLRNDQRFVYLRQGPEEFAKHVVEVLAEDDARAYLRPTLPPNACVVRQGAQFLLSEQYKESIQLIEEGGGANKTEPSEQTEKGGQAPFVRSTLRAVPANGACPPFSDQPRPAGAEEK